MRIFFACLFLIITGLITYAFVLRGVWENPTVQTIQDNVNDATKPRGTAAERGRFILTQNLINYHTFSLSREQAEASSPDVGYYKEGKYYIFFAPGISIFSIPFYIMGLHYNLSQVFTYAMTALFAITNLVLIFLISKKILNLTHWASIFASLTFGFASTSLSYATTLYQHHAAVFFILSSFYAVYQYKIHRKWGFFWGFFIWLNYALAISIDYPNAILMLPVMVYFLFVSLNIKKEDNRYKISFRLSLLLTSIFFVAITLLHGYYNNQNFGGWTKVSGSLIGIRAINEQHLDKGDLDQNIKMLKQTKNPVGFFKEINLVNSSYELLIAPDKGLLIFSPIFILGFLGIYLIIKKNKVTLENGTLISLIVVNLFLYSSWGDPWGGWAFGPRYLIPSMAFLSILIAYAIDKSRWLFKIFAFLLFVFSSAIAFLGALTTYAVPPKIEAIPLKAKYGFMYNVDFLTQNKTGDFLFNYFLHDRLNLMQYYLIILGSISFIAFIVLFILPLFNRQEKVEE